MFTLNDILQGCGEQAHLHSTKPADPAQVFPGAWDNSQHIGPGDLFIAIKGAHTEAAMARRAPRRQQPLF